MQLPAMMADAFKGTWYLFFLFFIYLLIYLLYFSGLSKKQFSEMYNVSKDGNLVYDMAFRFESREFAEFLLVKARYNINLAYSVAVYCYFNAELVRELLVCFGNDVRKILAYLKSFRDYQPANPITTYCMDAMELLGKFGDDGNKAAEFVGKFEGNGVQAEMLLTDVGDDLAGAQKFITKCGGSGKFAGEFLIRFNHSVEQAESFLKVFNGKADVCMAFLEKCGGGGDASQINKLFELFDGDGERAALFAEKFCPAAAPNPQSIPDALYFIGKFNNVVKTAEEFIQKFGNDARKASLFLVNFGDCAQANEFLELFQQNGLQAEAILSMFENDVSAVNAFMGGFSNEKAAADFCVLLNSLGLKRDQVVEFKKNFSDIGSISLLYDTKEHEQTLEACHEKIDHAGSTLTFVLRGSKVAGGIAYREWNQNDEPINDPAAAIFMFGEQLRVFNASDGTKALCGAKNRGPKFGTDEFAVSFATKPGYIIVKLNNPCFQLPPEISDFLVLDKIKYQNAKETFYGGNVDRVVVCSFEYSPEKFIQRQFPDGNTAEEFSGKFSSVDEAVNFVLSFPSVKSAELMLGKSGGDGDRAAKWLSSFKTTKQALQFTSCFSDVDKASEFLEKYKNGDSFELSALECFGITSQQAKDFAACIEDMVSFNVLYDSNVEELSAQACHDKIDGKSPTVTLIIKGDVFYLFSYCRCLFIHLFLIF